ncbi:transporter family-2 protein [Saccharopolyspora erythraea NRRL 2338]|uniref:Integral membrane protein n=2 Tax=Saccharopolyspora erythraea TaxID=1836 RepID=A4FI13_SACEN|nr:DMT family transporter [Saccharopolyspora erythraea]EQD85071.1 membrane protein [Saccharopolyspora erythraea D]PFG97372.1 transporter family-2 protein [Saccharopolyspora erythraea NRRL 2338]QRK87553.1 DMT family transporter [Saccharopolyspora erythraea]CAM03688.1 integral membrane protein [Saccharopolyspora erythraea NRRL 2338]
MYVVLLATALLAGCLLAVQASANLRLTSAVGTPYGASTLQLGVAAGLLAVLATAVGAIGAARLVPGVPVWHLLGGLASPLYITSGILLFPRLGALAAAGLFVTGQMFASLGLDLFGLLGVARRPLTAGIVVGAVAVLAGITVIIRGPRPAHATDPRPAHAVDRQPAHAVDPRSARAVDRQPARAVAAPRRTGGRLVRAGWVALGIAAGAVLPLQGAVNAALRADLGHALTVGVISFVVATLTIAVVLMVLLALGRTPRPKPAPLSRMPWWGWLGGACAAAYVTATFTLIPVIGAATTIALTVTGQQLASAAIDNHGLFRLPRRRLTTRRTAGLALLVLGSALVQLT